MTTGTEMDDEKDHVTESVIEKTPENKKETLPPVIEKKKKKTVVMTAEALENLKKARAILKIKRDEAKNRGEKLISKKKLKKISVLAAAAKAVEV